MSIIYCEIHDIRWDSDFKDECPRCENEVVESSAPPTGSAAGAEAQLLRLAKAHGYERVWHDPRDETTWFAERKHPEKDGMIQAIPMDWLLQPPNATLTGAPKGASS